MTERWWCSHSRQIENSLLSNVPYGKKLVAHSSERHYSRNEWNSPIQSIRMVNYLKIHSFHELERIKYLKFCVPIIGTFHKLQQIWYDMWIQESCFTHLDPEDYIRITKTLTFIDTVTNIPVNITIVDDLEFEPVEHFNISLSTSSDGYVISPGNELVPVFITDDGEIVNNAHCTCISCCMVVSVDGKWYRSHVLWLTAK